MRLSYYSRDSGRWIALISWIFCCIIIIIMNDLAIRSYVSYTIVATVKKGQRGSIRIEHENW